MDNKKNFVVKMIESTDEYGTTESQELWSDDDKHKINYQVYNLWGCPEDACIDRDLFSAYEYFEALKLGFQLAKEGYQDIVLQKEEEEDD